MAYTTWIIFFVQADWIARIRFIGTSSYISHFYTLNGFTFWCSCNCLCLNFVISFATSFNSSKVNASSACLVRIQNGTSSFFNTFSNFFKTIPVRSFFTGKIRWKHSFCSCNSLFFPFLVMINHITVGWNYASNIFRTFHAAFNFKRINASFNQVRNFVNQFKIIRRKEISLFRSAWNICCIQTATCLCTHSPVCRFSAKKTRKKAESWLTYTQSPMNKHFKFHICLSFYGTDFFEAKFTGNNCTFQTFLAQII